MNIFQKELIILLPKIVLMTLVFTLLFYGALKLTTVIANSSGGDFYKKK